MIDLFLTIFTGIIFIVIWIICTYLMIFLMHPLEKQVATFAKIIVVLSMSLAFANVLMLPLDVASRVSAFGGIPMSYMWLAIYILITLLCVFILPFAIAYYEGEDADGRASQCGEGVKWACIFFVVFAALFLVGYFFIGYSDIPIVDITAPIVDANLINTQPCTPETCGIVAIHTTVTFKVGFIIFMIATLSALGWILLVFFGGIGLVALPVDLINKFRFRPIPIDKKEYDSSKIKIGERAEMLLGKAEGWESKKPGKKEKNEWKKQVYMLDQQFLLNEVAYKKKGGVVVVYYFKLILGIFGTLLTILWVAQIVIWTNMQLLSTLYSNIRGYAFLNLMFVALDRVWAFFGVLIFAILAFWLMMCVIKGNFKWGIRVPFFITIHPMRKNGTMLNSMLVNTTLILAASVAVTHLCAGSFSIYVRMTPLNTIFNVTIRYLRGVFYYWLIIHWALIGFVVLASIYFMFRPVDDDVKLIMEARAKRSKRNK